MAAAASRWIAPIPNFLSAVRVALAGIFPMAPPPLRAPIVVAAGASDVLDGWIARRFHATSEAGRLIDGIADKTFVVSAAVTLAAEGVVPWWQVALVMARDVTVAAIAAICVARSAWGAFRQMKPRVLGKATTFAAFLWFTTVLVDSLAPIRLPALVLAAACSLGAAFDYASQLARGAANHAG